MAVLEPLSKQVIRNAYLNSYRGKPGQEKFEPDLFITHFGRFVLGQFSGIRLIGEIEYKEGKETHEVFRDCLREVLVEKNLWHICQSGTKSWRAILSFYFVSTAIFSYGEETGNELWPHVMRGLGLEKDGNLSQQCGELFLKCLKENKLERFGSLKCGHPFTTRILLHGLIPTRHIDRFVSELIQPELHNHVGIYSTGAYLIQKWQQSGNFRYLPKPIQRFIEHGSFASVHVADRFLEMAKRWNEDDPTLARQWGLPEYMVDAFRRNIQNGNDARSRKPWVGTSRGRPYLFFDLEKSEAPILCIPSQQFKSAVVFQLKWSDLHGGSHIANIPVHFTSIDGNFYSDPQDLEVKPNVEGWELEIVDQSSGSIFPQFIPVSLPAGSNEERIPLLFFNRDTGKLFYPENGRSLPSELLLVFRKGCSLEVQGCTLSGEPERLTGFWRDWQYILCTLQGEDASLIFKFHSESTATLSKTIRLSSGDTGDKLEFGEDGQAPSWIRCLEKWPVFVDAKKICIRCDEFGSRIWGRAYGKIIRRDQDGYAAALDLNFHQKENAWESCLPFPDHWEPGVYEIQLRGPLGIEDAILPFVYIPQEVCRRAIDPETGIAIEFQLGRLSGLGIELLPHTAIVEDESKCIITPHHEQGIAFCGFKLFHPSRQSITLLLARNELRWSMRSEQGLFRWDHWRCVPEEIPLQRLDELADASA